MHDRLTMAPLPAPAELHGLVLMLHGGAERGDAPVDHRSLALRRTGAMFRAISGDLAEHGAATALLRFSVKGWQAKPAGSDATDADSTSGRTPSPVADARLAIRDLHTAHPDLPIVLLGHSMGARTAAWVADEPGVVGVVGLAPWFPTDDPVEALAGKHLVAAHGRRDRITSARATRRFVERAQEVAAEARFVDMGGVGHYMLRGIGAWNRVALTETVCLLDRAVARPEPDVRSVTPQECNQH
ncbi:MAG: alpha/beta hydrolase [Marmoricola sp.]